MYIMAETNLYYLVHDIESAVSEGNSKSIHKNTNIIFKEIFDSLNFNEKLKSLQSILSNLQNVLSHHTEKSQTYSNELFALGRCAGCIEFLDVLLKYKIRKERSNNIFTTSEAKNIPHINDVISYISKQPGIRHGELSNKVGVEKNTLTSIMSKLVDSGLVTYARPGKFKYYYLTDQGKNYYKDNLEHFKTSYDINYLIEQLLLVVSNSSNPSELVGKIMTSLYAGHHEFEGYESKIAKNITPLSLIPKIIAENPVSIYFNNNDNTYIVDSAELITFYKSISTKSILYLSHNSNENTSDLLQASI